MSANDSVATALRTPACGCRSSLEEVDLWLAGQQRLAIYLPDVGLPLIFEKVIAKL